jgi:MFS family permease
MTGFRDLRKNHDFTVLWIGQTISELGTRVSMFVFPLVTYAATGSALLAGLAGGLELLGTAIALLPGGLLADRADRRRVMRTASGLGVLLYASLVVAGVLGALTVPHLFVVGVLTGVCAGVFAPAEMSAVRAVVPREQLPTALSQQQARQHVASLVGGPLGGALYSVTRWVPFLFDAVTFAASWVLLGRIRTDLSPAARPVDAGAVRRRARADIADGLRFQWSRPFFRTILVWGMCSNLVINALFVAATVRLIQGGFAPWSIGLVETAAGVCGVLGALVAPRIIERTATGVLTVVVAWSFVPLLVPLIFWNNPVVVMVSLSTGVFLNPAGNAGIGSYKMSITPPELVGRVQSVGQFLGWSTLPLAPVLGGALLAALGGPAAMAVLTVLCALVALIPTLSRTVRSVPRPAEWPQLEVDEAQPAPAPEPALV